MTVILSEGVLRRILSERLLPAYVPRQRWFQAKDQKPESMSFRFFEKVLVQEEITFYLSIVQVEFPRLPPQKYFLPLAVQVGSQRAGPDCDPRWEIGNFSQAGTCVRVMDAVAFDAFLHEFLSRLGSPPELPEPWESLEFQTTGIFPHGVSGKTATFQRPRLEQSHTGILVNQLWFLKIYRRLMDDPNPEVEVGRFLTEHTSFRRIAQVAGYASWHGPRGRMITLAVMQTLLENHGPAWEDSLRDLEQGLAACSEGMAAGCGRAGYPPAQNIGLRLGQLHRALSGKVDVPAFSPQPIRRSDLTAWVTKVRDEWEKILPILPAVLPRVPEALRLAAESLLRDPRSLLDPLVRDAPRHLRAVKSRFHGDLHLGQVLMAETDCFFIDFEGEPGKPVRERRKKHSPLRDVAGMMRSFSYAAHMALMQFQSSGKVVDDNARAFVRDWEHLSQQAFLGGYRQGAGNCPVIPEDPAHFDWLVSLFSCEKALYELEYEIRNRPDWIAVPLAGILDLAHQGG